MVQPQTGVDLTASSEQHRPALYAGRIESIDLLRGLVIILMVLDHVRDFFLAYSFQFNPTDLEHTTPSIFLTRWITHLCAPAFVLLAGISAYLQRANGKSRGELSRFLFIRGLWLVILELTLVGFVWNFSFDQPYLQVIWVIGISMIVMSLLIWLPAPVILAFALIVIAGHNLLTPINGRDLGDWSAPIWTVLHDGGFIPWQVQRIIVTYPLLPWPAVMALGYCLGSLFVRPPEERHNGLVVLGCGAILLFVVLRWSALYGDPRHWLPQDEAWKTVFSFFNATKYPASLIFLLMTIGPSLLLLVFFDRLKGPVAEVFLTYGRVPLFAYVMHILIGHSLMMAIGMAIGDPAHRFVNFLIDDDMIGWGFGLPTTYALWLVTLVLLYPLCRWFSRLKERRRNWWWLSYL